MNTTAQPTIPHVPGSAWVLLVVATIGVLLVAAAVMLALAGIEAFRRRRADPEPPEGVTYLLGFDPGANGHGTCVLIERHPDGTLRFLRTMQARVSCVGGDLHHYVSTYCMHDDHNNCRHTCKTCGAPCACDADGCPCNATNGGPDHIA